MCRERLKVAADTLASSGAPARAYDAAGIGTIASAGEPLEAQETVPLNQAMGQSGKKKAKNRKTKSRATARA